MGRSLHIFSNYRKIEPYITASWCTSLKFTSRLNFILKITLHYFRNTSKYFTIYGGMYRLEDIGHE